MRAMRIPGKPDKKRALPRPQRTLPSPHGCHGHRPLRLPPAPPAPPPPLVSRHRGIPRPPLLAAARGSSTPRGRRLGLRGPRLHQRRRSPAREPRAVGAAAVRTGILPAGRRRWAGCNNFSAAWRDPRGWRHCHLREARDGKDGDGPRLARYASANRSGRWLNRKRPQHSRRMGGPFGPSAVCWCQIDCQSTFCADSTWCNRGQAHWVCNTISEIRDYCVSTWSSCSSQRCPLCGDKSIGRRHKQSASECLDGRSYCGKRGNLPSSMQTTSNCYVQPGGRIRTTLTSYCNFKCPSIEFPRGSRQYCNPISGVQRCFDGGRGNGCKNSDNFGKRISEGCCYQHRTAQISCHGSYTWWLSGAPGVVCCSSGKMSCCHGRTKSFRGGPESCRASYFTSFYHIPTRAAKPTASTSTSTTSTKSRCRRSREGGREGGGKGGRRKRKTRPDTRGVYFCRWTSRAPFLCSASTKKKRKGWASKKCHILRRQGPIHAYASKGSSQEISCRDTSSSCTIPKTAEREKSQDKKSFCKDHESQENGSKSRCSGHICCGRWQHGSEPHAECQRCSIEVACRKLHKQRSGCNYSLPWRLCSSTSTIKIHCNGSQTSKATMRWRFSFSSWPEYSCQSGIERKEWRRWAYHDRCNHRWKSCITEEIQPRSCRCFRRTKTIYSRIEGDTCVCKNIQGRNVASRHRYREQVCIYGIRQGNCKGCPREILLPAKCFGRRDFRCHDRAGGLEELESDLGASIAPAQLLFVPSGDTSRSCSNLCSCPSFLLFFGACVSALMTQFWCRFSCLLSFSFTSTSRAKIRALRVNVGILPLALRLALIYCCFSRQKCAAVGCHITFLHFCKAYELIFLSKIMRRKLPLVIPIGRPWIPEREPRGRDACDADPRETRETISAPTPTEDTPQSPWLPWPPPSPPPSRTSRPAASPRLPPPRYPSPPAPCGGERLLHASRPSPRPPRSSTPPTAPFPRPRAPRRRGSSSTDGNTSRWPPSLGRMQLKLLCCLARLTARLEALPSPGSAGRQRRWPAACTLCFRQSKWSLAQSQTLTPTFQKNGRTIWLTKCSMMLMVMSNLRLSKHLLCRFHLVQRTGSLGLLMLNNQDQGLLCFNLVFLLKLTEVSFMWMRIYWTTAAICFMSRKELILWKERELASVIHANHFLLRTTRRKDPYVNTYLIVLQLIVLTFHVLMTAWQPSILQPNFRSVAKMFLRWWKRKLRLQKLRGTGLSCMLLEWQNVLLPWKDVKKFSRRTLRKLSLFYLVLSYLITHKSSKTNRLHLHLHHLHKIKIMQKIKMRRRKMMRRMRRKRRMMTKKTKNKMTRYPRSLFLMLKVDMISSFSLLSKHKEKKERLGEQKMSYSQKTGADTLSLCFQRVQSGDLLTRHFEQLHHTKNCGERKVLTRQEKFLLKRLTEPREWLEKPVLWSYLLWTLVAAWLTACRMPKVQHSCLQKVTQAEIRLQLFPSVETMLKFYFHHQDPLQWLANVLKSYHAVAVLLLMAVQLSEWDTLKRVATLGVSSLQSPMEELMYHRNPMTQKLPLLQTHQDHLLKNRMRYLMCLQKYSRQECRFSSSIPRTSLYLRDSPRKLQGLPKGNTTTCQMLRTP
uniref:Potassium transporters and magnesium chelatase ChlI domain protein n=1 Tax=Triticum aestivum TaxID=4565 RepID=A0A2Z6ERP8_WHEAT|nr:potassium transporters and magnesium chelatase ChlI domain protein [Triticum aestivum]